MCNEIGSRNRGAMVITFYVGEQFDFLCSQELLGRRRGNQTCVLEIPLRKFAQTCVKMVHGIPLRSSLLFGFNVGISTFH
jgi:hypothetical protein